MHEGMAPSASGCNMYIVCVQAEGVKSPVLQLACFCCVLRGYRCDVVWKAIYGLLILKFKSIPRGTSKLCLQQSEMQRHVFLRCGTSQIYFLVYFGVDRCCKDCRCGVEMVLLFLGLWGVWDQP